MPKIPPATIARCLDSGDDQGSPRRALVPKAFGLDLGGANFIIMKDPPDDGFEPGENF